MSDTEMESRLCVVSSEPTQERSKWWRSNRKLRLTLACFYRSQTKLFSQVSVCPQAGRAWWGGVRGGGACVVGGHAWQGGVHGRRCVWWGGGHAWQGGACMVGETATAAGGTHPTGMHSCNKNANTNITECYYERKTQQVK